MIVFSPGESDSPACCNILTRHWAIYGNVTLQPTYDDLGLPQRNRGKETSGSLKGVS